MELELNVSDKMEMRDSTPRRPRSRVVHSYTPVSQAEYIRRHRLLLAEALAIAFVILILWNSEADSE